MAQRFNQEDAEQIARNHEDAGEREWNQPPTERSMDEANNRAGRECGTDPNADCAASCMDALFQRRLFDEGGVPMPVPPSRPPVPFNPGPSYE